jgi:hypothetical protein
MQIPDEEWIKTFEDGRKAKFSYQALPEDRAFITAQVAGNEVVYSIGMREAEPSRSAHREIGYPRCCDPQLPAVHSAR